jgi:hypothetical protein
MELLVLLLLIAGFVCFLLAAFSFASPRRVNLIALGLACWILPAVIGAFQNI